MSEELESGLTPEDPYQRRRELNRRLKRAFPDSDSAGMRIEMEDLRQKLEHAEARADAYQQQAQIWKQEARTQSAIVAEIYQELTGKTGEHGDWNGGRPLRAEILRKQAEKLDEIAAHIKEAAEAGLSSVASIYEGLKLNSSSLRQQADEIESGGGDE